MENIAIIGAGGHAKIIVDLINELNIYKIIGFYDDSQKAKLYDIKYLGNTKNIDETIENVIIAIGNDELRKKIYEENKDLKWCSLIHPSSKVSKHATIFPGTVVCAGAVIQTDVIIGKHCIINTNCNIDHESIIGNFTSISPSATICGQVNIGNSAFIGANATIIQNIKIGNNSIIGAGSVIINNVNNDCKVVGNPGRTI
jgi:acetyltransferase EpsM